VECVRERNRDGSERTPFSCTFRFRLPCIPLDLLPGGVINHWYVDREASESGNQPSLHLAGGKRHGPGVRVSKTGLYLVYAQVR